MKKSINWSLIIKVALVIVFIIGVLVVWRFFSGQVAAGMAAIGSLFGFGGKAVVRKADKRAKKKADQIPISDPSASVDSINELKRR